MSLHVFWSLFPSCPIHLYSEKLVFDRWLAQDLRESLHSSPGTAFCSRGSKTKVGRYEGFVRRHITCWGCFDAHWKSQTWCEPCCNLQLVQPNPPSSPVFWGSQSYPWHCGDTTYAPGITKNAKNSDDRTMKVKKDVKPHAHNTYTQTHKIYCLLTVFQVLSGSTCLSGAHTAFHSDHCWQKRQAASSRYLCDKTLMGKARFAWGWTVFDRGICVE